ncbi:hypothetical protein ACFZC3_22440 [Streptomyces sp. NPDC007903]|uniref:hypothetical protein n=1 Tax=Streptomyces sp. NPDC007903 TaxID=3364786 RepID=UPI0036E2C979
MTTHSANGLRPIRSPRGIPLLGHTPQIPSTNPVEYFGELSKQFPEGLYGMEIAGIEQVFVWDPDLVAEVCDETRSLSRSTRRRWPMSATTREPPCSRPTSTRRNGAWRTGSSSRPSASGR